VAPNRRLHGANPWGRGHSADVGKRGRCRKSRPTTIQPYIDSVVMVSKTEPTGRNARPVASVATRTISEFTTLRQQMRAKAERVPAGV
jgi:hypothetical protein